MCVKGGKGETLSLIFSKKFALFQPDVVHLIGRTAPVGELPLVDRASTAFPVTDFKMILHLIPNNLNDSSLKNENLVIYSSSC